MKGVWDLGSEMDIITNSIDFIYELESYRSGKFDDFRSRVLKKLASQDVAPEYVLMWK